MKFPFEATLPELEAELDSYVDSVFAALESEFLILPRGEGFVEYAAFEGAFQALKQATAGFTLLDPQRVLLAALEAPLVLVVLRAILGFTPPEWAYVTARREGVALSQGFIRNLDRQIRKEPSRKLPGPTPQLRALVVAACSLLAEPVPEVEGGRIHRLDKADTRLGLTSIRHFAELGVPYAMLLYERFLGRPFAGHRDSVSELVGGGLETKIEEILVSSGVSYRKTKRAAQVPGFDQAPDFLVPDELNPRIILEAKLTEDDGTARDKVTRVQHLDELSRKNQPPGRQKFEVIACIAGRGFGVRRSDMRKLLLATQGKVFTLKTLDQLVENSALREFRTAGSAS
jgi:hypothetical protein